MSKVSLINDEYHVDMSIVKMEQVASQLTGLLRHKKISRAELAQELGWSKGRVTRVLSGDVNLTLKTITTITQKLGYDFDVIFHNENYNKPKQPWQIDRDNNVIISSQQNTSEIEMVFQMETGSQVVDAVLAGREKDLYISISSPSVLSQVSAIPSMTPKITSRDPAINITYLNQSLEIVHHE
ncbi:helix-turn-helix domain-containing protein [Acinetobacter sp. CFCC 10889]|uniref:helix-turn-helix domain-containing protein n=1 Tax=Acinetobacter sp. CFCC 10889 TaxID=1775557 RepID=UPI000DD0D225|nr:helix-turn-helix domain-containing protein [Acinetobacter sp. CFCC 10889]